MLTALRAATAERHALLDSTLAIGTAGATLAHYREHLCMLHAWLLPLELWQDAFADGPQGAQTLPIRRLSDRIEADLADAAMPAGPACEGRQRPWPADASAAYRWGVAYVVEGSQLGGAVLYQRLAARLAPHPLLYLRGDAHGPGPRWRSFMQQLRGAVLTPEAIVQACAGACDAFDRILALREQLATPAPDCMNSV